MKVLFLYRFLTITVIVDCLGLCYNECYQWAGVVLTGAGATYPLGIDPKDSNIRIAPTFPPNHELEVAMDVFCICARLAACEKILNK